MHMLYSASPPGDFLLLSYCANSLWFTAAEISFVNISIPCLDLLQILKIIIMFSFFNNTDPLHNSFHWFSLHQGDFPVLRQGTWGKVGFSQTSLSTERTEPLFPQQNPSLFCRTPLSSTEPLFPQQNPSFPSSGLVLPRCVELSSPSPSSSSLAAASPKALLIC